MPSHPTSSTCSQCDATVPGPRDPRSPIGPPFVQCQGCDAFITRTGHTEWSLMRFGSRLELLSGTALRGVAVGALPVLVFIASARVKGATPELQRTVIIAVAGILLGSIWSAARLSRLISRSRRRMSDPMYLARLAAHARASTPPIEDQTKSQPNQRP